MRKLILLLLLVAVPAFAQPTVRNATPQELSNMERLYALRNLFPGAVGIPPGCAFQVADPMGKAVRQNLCLVCPDKALLCWLDGRAGLAK